MSSTTSPQPSLLDDHVALAIERHVAATSAILARVLIDTARSLDEPRAPDPARSLLLLATLVEMLLGTAAGCVIGRVVTATLRGLGDDVSYRLEIPLREALRHIGPGQASAPASVLGLTPLAFTTGTGARPLIDELAARLHLRLGQASADHRTVLIQLATSLPADRARSFASTLASLDDDSMLSWLWADHLTVAWRYYAIAAGNQQDAEPALPPALAGSSISTTWRAWLRRVRGEPSPAAPRAADYIMAIVG